MTKADFLSKYSGNGKNQRKDNCIIRLGFEESSNINSFSVEHREH